MPEPPLPNFDDPPVVEAALAVWFDPLPKLRTAQLGLLSREFHPRFPIVEEQPLLPRTVELFGVRRPRGVEVRLEMLDQPPPPRLWFFNTVGTEVIQIQQDLFGHSWRKVGEGDTYPHYERIRQTVADELEVFRRFVAEQQLGELAPHSCEVTYINHIEAGKGWERHAQMAEVLTLLKPADPESLLPEPEEMQLAARYVIPGDGGEPIGRLHISAEPAYRAADDKPILVLLTSATGAKRPRSCRVVGLFGFACPAARMFTAECRGQ